MARPRRRTAAPGSLGAFVGAGPRETGLGHGDMETLPTWRRYVPRERVAACSVRTNALRQPRPCLREADGTTRLPSAGFSHTHPRRCKLQDKGRGVHYRNVRLFHPATSWDVNNSKWPGALLTPTPRGQPRSPSPGPRSLALRVLKRVGTWKRSFGGTSLCYMYMYK